MSNIIFKDKHLIIKERKKGLGLTGASILCFILSYLKQGLFPKYIFILIAGIFCIGIVSFMMNFHLKYLEINKDILYIYPTGEYSHRYEIPLTRVSFISTTGNRMGFRRQNIKFTLNSQYGPIFYVSTSYKKIYEKNDIEFYSFPISKKTFPKFIKLLDTFNIRYKSNNN